MSVVDTAKNLLGKVKYQFGATSINTNGGVADCSSFTQFVFKQNGIDIPRTAALQYQQGTAVDKSNLQPGDLIFFSGTSSHAKISHVGIYVGDNKFIHNSSKSGTITSDLSGYYAEHYYGAKRINGSASNAITDTSSDHGFLTSIAMAITKGMLIIIAIVLCFVFFTQAFDIKTQII